MDKQHIEEQIVLLIMGEETEIPEKEIRRIIAGSPEFQAFYRETLSTLEITAKRTPPPVSDRQWHTFILNLHERLERKKGREVLVRFAEFFRSPVRASVAASIAAVLIIGIALLTHSPEVTITRDPKDSEKKLTEYLPYDIVTVDSAYTLAENLLPTDEELYLIEEIYAGFAQQEESSDSLEDLPDSYQYEIEDLLRIDNSNGQEELS